MYSVELRGIHFADDALCFVDSAPWWQAVHHRHGLDYRYEKRDDRNSVNMLFKN